MKDRNNQKGRFSSSIRIRLTPRMEAALNEYIQKNDTTYSNVLREAIAEITGLNAAAGKPEGIRPAA